MPYRARAAAGGGGGRPGSGSGLGLGSGSGSLPDLVLFESGLTGMGCEHTRTRPAPLRIQTARQWLSENRLCGWAVAQLGGWTEQLRRFSSNRCNCWKIADENAPNAHP